MKFKSKILTHEQPVIAIETADLYSQKSLFLEEKISIQNGIAERIISNSLISDGVVILDIQMCFSDSQTIQSEITGESILMNFICCKNVEANIDKVESEKYTTENTHNILYASNFNATFEIPAFEEINYLTIILSLDYYHKLINEENIQNYLYYLYQGKRLEIKEALATPESNLAIKKIMNVVSGLEFLEY